MAGQPQTSVGRTHIDLLRHGETLAGSVYLGRSDALLSEYGYRQMSEALPNAPCYHAVLSSPLARCAAFAKDYAQQHKLPLHYDPRFQEMDFGAWDGCSAAEIAAADAGALENFWRDPIACPPPQAEPLLSFQTRVLAAWQELPARYSDQRVLLITHGGVMRIILCHLQQRPLTELLSLSVPHAALHQIITSDLAVVVGQPSRMASSFISVEHEPQQTGQVPA